VSASYICSPRYRPLWVEASLLKDTRYSLLGLLVVGVNPFFVETPILLLDTGYSLYSLASILSSLRQQF